jgi:hypothetical protein
VGLRAPKPTRPLTTAEARYVMAGKTLSRMLPPIRLPHARHTPTVNHIMEWRLWGWGTFMTLITAAPYYVLLWIFGPWIITNVFALYFIVGQRTHPLYYVITFVLGCLIVSPRVRRRWRIRNDKQRTRFRDRPFLSAIAFIAESEHWTECQRMQASLTYAIALLCRGIFPLFTLLTGMATCRLYMALYLSELRDGKTCDEALSHIVTVRTIRILVSVCLLTIVTVVVKAA